MNKNDTKVKCKYCDKDFTFTMYNSINPKSMKDAFIKTYMGEIFIHKCPHCNKENMILYPVTYTDLDKGFMVQFVKDFNEAKIAKDEHDKMCKDKVFGLMLSKLNYSVVIASAFNFMKKIAILNYNLDSRKIELMEKKLKQEHGAMDVSFFVNPMKDIFYFIMYFNDGKEEDIKFDKELYNSL